MKNLFKVSVVLVMAAMAFSSCNCFKKMAKHQDEVSIVCTPEVLVLNNGKVAADITASFPEKYFNAKAVLKVTPVIVFEGGEVAGATKYYQGSKVDDNYTVVDKKNGGKFTQHVEFAYDERMQVCELQLRVEIKCPKGKCKEFTLVNANTGAIPTKEEAAVLAKGGAEAQALLREFGLTVATGINTLQKDIKFADAMADAAHNYKNVKTYVTKADILYAINSSNATKKAVKNADLDEFKANVDATLNNDRAEQHIYVNGYASPDGPEKFNDKLSKARSESGKKVVVKLLKDTGLDTDAAFYGEDWEGFQELVAASNIEDKELILQVLKMYESSTQREAEIKNMASVFKALKNDILPKLRRAQVVNSTDVTGKTDAEMKALLKAKNYDALDNEELLYCAESLAECNKCKAEILKYTAEKYNDARAYNNLGVAYAKLGENEASLKAFEKAAKLGLNTAEIDDNLALANLANGNVDAAKKYAASADAETKSLVAAAEGNYEQAAKTLKGYNAAVANVMNENYTAAKQNLTGDNSADADYLRAVVAVKEGDLETAKAQLKSAVSKNGKLAEKAAKDANLKPLFKNGFAL